MREIYGDYSKKFTDSILHENNLYLFVQALHGHYVFPRQTSCVTTTMVPVLMIVPANSSFMLISKAASRQLGNGGNKDSDKDAFERGFWRTCQ
jgi:hypothetical protein